ncbi:MULTISPECIES: hypothetical protein [Aeromonas]|uniref:hypothetical protein n=1 Tax=Aeromonas TaxID=642 RepID=UPI000A9078A7|nr:MULTISPECIES: hypothetical protein [Aeromonas]MCH7372154.1 hypothetical protein [Aeromonas sp. MR16]
MACLLEELGEIGCALLLVTHDEALADKVGDRCLRLGRTLASQDEGQGMARVRRAG